MKDIWRERGGTSEAEDRPLKEPRHGGRAEVIERGRRQTPSTGCQTKSRTNEC